MAALPNLVRGLEELAPRYDVILFDQYGCIHDGVAPLPGACDALERLKGECKQMVVLSNTSSRRDATCRKFVNMGFSAAYMCDFITSGQCAHEHLAKHYVGKKCLWFTWESYASDTYLSDVGVQWTENVDEADLVLFHGSQTLARSARDDGIALGLFEHGISALEQSNARLREGSAIELLRSAARRGLPAINANPDFTVMFPDGTARHMPGCLADAYDALLRDISGTPGAATLRFGKPHGAHFRAAIAAANAQRPAGAPPPRVLHVGDSLHHDVRGASDAGVDSLLITKYGVHKDQLHHDAGDLLQQVCALADREGCPRPTFVLEACRW
eukprot:TRINITY_DN12500_c0_g1_i2.p1 TRINITY_DN12500_c0_g1~~TRINITY_DN12500_c0_g1_i2.p1  ORF type:complete len:329 (+),score=52.29 TRINITY_DN12500_c0_g1_i2:43-1029(+)